MPSSAPEPPGAVVAILGGSSAFLPRLAADLADGAGALPPLEIRLQGRDPRRTSLVARFCDRHAAARSVPHDWVAARSVTEAAAGADVVVNLIRVGGWAGRSHDERFPLAAGIPGDETIGPGGLSSAVRSLPVVLRAAREAAGAAPGAWFINLSNPMGILLAGLRSIEGIRSFGLCELPERTLAHALSRIGRDANAVRADYLGLNHQGWFVRVRDDGGDLLPTLFEALSGPPADRFIGVDAAILRHIGALPLPYMRLYYHTDREARRLRSRAESRGRELGAIAARLYEWYERSESGELPRAIDRRPMPWFRLALVPALVSLLGGGPSRLYVSETNGGDIPGLPAEAIVEKRCEVTAAGPRTLPFDGPPPHEGGAYAPLLSLLRRIVHFERAALASALDPCPDRIFEALRTHPLCREGRKVRALVPSIIGPAGATAVRAGGRAPTDPGDAA